MNTSPMSIRQRIVLYFAMLSLIVSLIFISATALFMWMVEDAAFQQILKTEKANVLEQYEATGQYGSVKHRLVQLAETEASLPEAVREGLKIEPNDDEFSGHDGENFHVLKIAPDQSVYLVGEFSELLIVNPALKKVLTLLMMTAVVLVVISCVIGFYLANRAVSPLSDLLALIKRSSAHSPPTRFSNNFADDEVGFLAKTLEQAMQEIAELIDREQNFTRDVSHELRTSISVIKGVGEILADTKTDAQTGVVMRLQAASQQMEQIVETLLALAREGKSLHDKTVFNVRPIVEDIVVQYARVIEDKPVELDINVKESDELYAHPVVVKILLSNLISNSFRHVQKGVISISFDNGKFTVSDNGGGIDDTLKERIFEAGVRGGDSEGYGIGLSLVKRLCEQQDIALIIASSGLGTSVTTDFQSERADRSTDKSAWVTVS